MSWKFHPEAAGVAFEVGVRRWGAGEPFSIKGISESNLTNFEMNERMNFISFFFHLDRLHLIDRLIWTNKKDFFLFLSIEMVLTGDEKIGPISADVIFQFEFEAWKVEPF